MVLDNRNPETLVLHAGPRSDASTGAVAVPIYQTTSYQFRDTGHAANASGADSGRALLVDQVRAANSRFKDVKVAVAEDYAPIPCASGIATNPADDYSKH